MRFFKKISHITAFLWIFVVNDSSALNRPEGGDRTGLMIKLEVPWTTFKIGEKFVYRYTLCNYSDKPVPIAIPVAKLGIRAVTGGQAFLEAFRENGRKAVNPTHDIYKALWPPRNNVDEEPQSWGELQPGQKLTWNQNNIWPDYYGVGCYESFEGFQGHWLVGPKRWISSETVSVKIVSVPFSEFVEVFKLNWSSYGYGKDSQTATVYRIPIEGKMYLFVNGTTRVTEVDSDDSFEYQIDKDGTNLEITITNGRGSRKVYFHLRQGFTRDTPWPIGPVELFDPKPEPIPPAELVALRKEAFPSQSNNKEKTDAGTTTKDGNSQASGDAKPDWFWIVIGLTLVGVTLVLVIYRKLRHS